MFDSIVTWLLNNREKTLLKLPALFILCILEYIYTSQILIYQHWSKKKIYIKLIKIIWKIHGSFIKHKSSNYILRIIVNNFDVQYLTQEYYDFVN